MKVYIIIFVLICVLCTCDDFFYKKINDIKNPNDIKVLVNKINRLNKNYIPNDLEKLNLNYSNQNKYLRHIAKINFEKLSDDAKKEGFNIIAVSAYRDYKYQKKLFNNYIKEKGLEYALKCSAKPGHSEHQTGLSVDVEGSNHDYNLFEKSKEFDWLRNNAHKYGFILRYPKNKEYITGFKYEPWHYRYVGVDIATIIYVEDITLEEYYFKYLK